MATRPYQTGLLSVSCLPPHIWDGISTLLRIIDVAEAAHRLTVMAAVGKDTFLSTAASCPPLIGGDMAGATGDHMAGQVICQA